ncbi:MAG TPA: hypothetical protein VHQ45_18485, partial [Gemmatimonadaceae bacterium]|nr:hypothetical protein [Gemmatimonadaceae bacterium]
VPVAFGGVANAGRVSSQTMAAFVGFARELYPLGAAEVDVRAPFAASASALRSRDENGAWEQTLSELNAARVAAGDGRMYFGLVRLPYASGIVGVGLLPGMTALGWDALPDAAFTLAHELGHNWGRRHSPCGSPPGVDDQYPYLDGSIGVTGYRFSVQELQQPDVSDVMGYCRHAWISDYTYEGVLSFRGVPPAPRMASTEPRPALLVWGRVRDGEVVLEPAFPVTAPVSLPTAGGPYRFTAIDATGRTAFSVAFDATPTADGADGGAAFAFAIPYDAARDAPLARLQVDGGRRPAVRLSRAAAPGAPGAPPAPAAPAPALSVTRAADGAATLRWDETAYPMAMVREAATGTILGFVRGGTGQVPAASGAVEVVLSDGVQTRVSRH